MIPLLVIAFCRKPDARTSSMKRLTAVRTSALPLGTMMVCGTPNRLSGKSLVPRRFAHQRREALPVGAKGVDLFSSQQALDLGGIVLDFEQCRLLQLAFQIERNGIVPDAGYDLSGAIDIGDRTDRRAVEHEKALLHQHVGLREFDRAGARRLVGNEADIGRAAADRVDHPLGVGGRLELDQHIDALCEFAREIGRYAANGAGGAVLHRLCRIAAEIDRTQRAARRDIVGACQGRKRQRTQQSDNP